MIRLCYNHRLELYKCGYGKLDAFTTITQPVCKKNKCVICNGTFKINQEISQWLLNFDSEVPIS